MLQRLKELLRHSAIYGVGSIIARVLAVLLLPLYTRYLSPSDYGLIETLVALSAVLTALVAQGMKSAFFRFYFDTAEPEGRYLVVRTAFWYVMAASTFVSLAGIVLAPQISWLLFGTHDHGRLVIAGQKSGLVFWNPQTGAHTVLRAGADLPDDHVFRLELDTMVSPPALYVATFAGAAALRTFP
jgi:hypothetical protein